MRPQHRGGGRVRLRLAAAGASVALVGGITMIAVAVPGQAAVSAAQGATDHNPCHLGNGIKHVVQINFDNVHFFRDNPNVPSDLELMPNLLNFIESNGTMLSNNHTPLIAHTADDIITNGTGLYGDRHGLGITNSYDVYNSSGGVTNKSAFAYWNANYGLDAFPNLAYSPTVPAAGSPPQVT